MPCFFSRRRRSKSSATRDPSTGEPDFTDPDSNIISAAIASGRFFSASPATSASISPAVGIGVPVRITATDLHSEFRQSMEVMAAALGVSAETELDVKVNILSELVFCYLELNCDEVHGYILRAYEELLISLSRGFGS